MRVLVFILMLAFLPGPSFAVVDMKNANYADTWQDLIAPGTGFDLRVRRSYNSRTLFNGMFGFGWCSDFETSVELTGTGALKLTECGGGLEVEFKQVSASPQQLKELVDTIATRIKKQSPNQNIAKIKEALVEDEEFREKYVDEFKLRPKLKSGAVFLANGKGVESITFKNSKYVRRLVDGTVQKFSQTGQLEFIGDTNANWLKLAYKGGKLTEMVDNNGRKLNFSYLSNGKVKEVRGPNNLKAEYKFKGDDLVWVKNGWHNSYTYTYDDLHNLIQINFPDKSSKKLAYNKDRDWVTSFTNRKGCVESYDYKIFGKKKNHYRSDVVKKCNNKITNKSSYEFWYKDRPDGTKFLAQVKSNNNGDKTEMTYHPVFGRPLSIIKNGSRVKYEYYSTGQVKMQITANQVSTFKYDNVYKKVSKVSTKYISPDKKQKRTVATNFKYNPKGNLIRAKNSLGQVVSLAYDSKGRIASIKDQTKKHVTIKYEERFGKPHEVESEGVGKIKVTYKSNGDIDKVDSKEGPIVAVQVASTFNNLLDIIAPATNQVKL